MATFTASCQATGETTAYFTAAFSGGDSSFQGYRYVLLTIDGDSRTVRSKERGGGSSAFSVNISGLSPDTTYSWSAMLGYQADGQSATTWLDSLTRSGSFTTDSPAISVDKWSWSGSNGGASASETRNAYSALSSGYCADFSYAVWNDLVDKVKEIQEALDRSWLRTYLSYSNTRMSSSDKTLTASRFNSLRWNLSLGEERSFSYYIPTVSRGETVYGRYFRNIASEINAWIDNL